MYIKIRLHVLYSLILFYTGCEWYSNWSIDWLNEWCFTLLSSVFQSHHGHSSDYSCLSWVLQVLGWGPEVSCQRTFLRNTQRIQCGSNPGPLDYESNTTTEPRRTPAIQMAISLTKKKKQELIKLPKLNTRKLIFRLVKHLAAYS